MFGTRFCIPCCAGGVRIAADIRRLQNRDSFASEPEEKVYGIPGFLFIVDRAVGDIRQNGDAVQQSDRQAVRGDAVRFLQRDAVPAVKDQRAVERVRLCGGELRQIGEDQLCAVVGTDLVRSFKNIGGIPAPGGIADSDAEAAFRFRFADPADE